MKIKLVVPKQESGPLEWVLTAITEQIAENDPKAISHGLLGGEYGYGGLWDSETFQMHPYCWCESVDCPWCAGCYCDGGKCAWCVGVHRWADMGALPPSDPPHLGAPNFWHKPSGLRVWWYKYIGRGMEVIGDVEDLQIVLDQCVSDVRSGRSVAHLSPAPDPPTNRRISPDSEGS